MITDTGGDDPVAHVAVGDDGRQELIARLDDAGRESSAATVMFLAAVSAKQGLGPTETKTLDLLARGGPLTAKELAERTGLAPPSITGLIDRLERKGFVRRRAHPSDGRRVLIEHYPEMLARVGEDFTAWAGELHQLYERFSDGELATIIRFLLAAARRQRALVAGLSNRAVPGGGASRRTMAHRPRPGPTAWPLPLPRADLGTHSPADSSTRTDVTDG